MGGRVFGYRNVDVVIGTDAHGRHIRSHVERAIAEEEAAVVRRIFALYAGGVGLKGIAKCLTLDGAAEPKPVTRKDGLTPRRAGPPARLGAFSSASCTGA
jgi:hypothetical protein